MGSCSPGGVGCLLVRSSIPPGKCSPPLPERGFRSTFQHRGESGGNQVVERALERHSLPEPGVLDLERHTGAADRRRIQKILKKKFALEKENEAHASGSSGVPRGEDLSFNSTVWLEDRCAACRSTTPWFCVWLLQGQSSFGVCCDRCDVDLDDIRAIVALAGSKNVVAIVTTEGISRPAEGASAVEHVLERIGAKKITVIPGESPNPARKYEADPRLEAWRSRAERLNGALEGSYGVSCW